jgi:hypothetical protein
MKRLMREAEGAAGSSRNMEMWKCEDVGMPKRSHNLLIINKLYFNFLKLLLLSLILCRHSPPIYIFSHLHIFPFTYFHIPTFPFPHFKFVFPLLANTETAFYL